MLSYTVCDPFQIVYATDYVSYYIRKFLKLNILELKYMAYDLYPFSLSLKPHELADMLDI